MGRWLDVAIRQRLEARDVGADDVEAGAPEVHRARVDAETRRQRGGVAHTGGGEQVIVALAKSIGPILTLGGVKGNICSLTVSELV